MVQPGDRVAAAVSGGGDSVALLLLLEQLSETLGITLAVVHFHHGLRGEEADADERFVRELATAHGLQCLTRREDVSAEARRTGANLEEIARKRRYAYFGDIVRQGQATRVATGHTADDQAETVLARLARGTGLRGLAAIHPVLGSIVRPLLDVRRSELREYLAACGQSWQEDATNLDAARLRTRIRRILPALERECGTRVVGNLARLAEQSRNDEALLCEWVEQRFISVADRRGTELAVAVRDLIEPCRGLKTAEASQALARRLVRRAVEEIKGNQLQLTAAHVLQVLALAQRGASGKRVELPGGVVAERVLDQIVFLGANSRRQTLCRGLVYSYPADPWSVGEAVVPIPETGKRLRLKLIDWSGGGRENYPQAAVLDADRLEAPLAVRNWLPGDAYRPAGRLHTEKLKRLLLEKRIAGRKRIDWPVLTSVGRPVWSAGLPAAADFAAGPGTRRALVVIEEAASGTVHRQTDDETRCSANASNRK
jgi:tRNA(Ile)-lysidine synthase